jgi:hypothetical protein
MELGAVYSPLLEIVPAAADQVTAVLALPVTVAVNCLMPEGDKNTVIGEIVTATDTGPAVKFTFDMLAPLMVTD